MLSYESVWTVKVDQDSITSRDYQGKIVEIDIKNIVEIKIITNDSGRGGTDLWWLIKDKEKSMNVPGGATGEEAMLDRLQKIDGFNNKEVINAMSSVENKEFTLLKK